jgi:tRNA (cytidine/uridine-2'-O-)-methyltransferase
VRIALFEPDIPQNAGAVLRLAACLAVAVDVIEPCGFVSSDARMRRAGLDYAAAAAVTRFPSWADYRARRPAGRLVLFTTRGRQRYLDFAFRADDTLLFGRESAGVPDAVHDAADATVYVPLAPGMRSLNVATAVAIGVSEALRQTGLLPPGDRG